MTKNCITCDLELVNRPRPGSALLYIGPHTIDVQWEDQAFHCPKCNFCQEYVSNGYKARQEATDLFWRNLFESLGIGGPMLASLISSVRAACLAANDGQPSEEVRHQLSIYLLPPTVQSPIPR